MFYLKLLPVNNILLYYLWMHKRKTVIFFLKFLKQQRIQHTRIMKVRKKIIERDIGSDTTLLCTYEPSLEFSLFGLLLTSFHSLSLSPSSSSFSSLDFNNLFLLVLSLSFILLAMLLCLLPDPANAPHCALYF